MILTTLALAVSFQATALVCPVSGAPVSPDKNPTFVRAGLIMTTCCNNCPEALKGDFAKATEKTAKSGKNFAYSAFDVVSGKRLDLKPGANKLPSVAQDGIVYIFENEKNRATFVAEPKKFTKVPEKQALYCTVMKHDVKSALEAGGFSDFEGVRYYHCCPNCLAAFNKDPKKFAANGAAAVKPVALAPFPKKG